MNNFGINLTHSTDDPDRATVAMTIANASVASGKNTMVFLSSEGVRLAIKGVADSIHEEGLQPMADLVKNYVRSEEHTSELQSHLNIVCRLLLEKKNPQISRP